MDKHFKAKWIVPEQYYYKKKGDASVWTKSPSKLDVMYGYKKKQDLNYGK